MVRRQNSELMLAKWKIDYKKLDDDEFVCVIFSFHHGGKGKHLGEVELYGVITHSLVCSIQSILFLLQYFSNPIIWWYLMLWSLHFLRVDCFFFFFSLLTPTLPQLQQIGLESCSWMNCTALVVCCSRTLKTPTNPTEWQTGFPPRDRLRVATGDGRLDPRHPARCCTFNWCGVHNYQVKD